METIDTVIAKWPVRKFKTIDLNTVEKLSGEILVAKRSHTKYLHSIEEKQLYTAHDFGVYGKIYRCRYRGECGARVVLLPSGQVVRLPDAKQHSHTTDESQQIKHLRAFNDIKKMYGDLRRVAGGWQITKVTDIPTKFKISKRAKLLSTEKRPSILAVEQPRNSTDDHNSPMTTIQNNDVSESTISVRINFMIREYCEKMQ